MRSSASQGRATSRLLPTVRLAARCQARPPAAAAAAAIAAAAEAAAAGLAAAKGELPLAYDVLRSADKRADAAPLAALCMFSPAPPCSSTGSPGCSAAHQNNPGHAVMREQSLPPTQGALSSCRSRRCRAR